MRVAAGIIDVKIIIGPQRTADCPAGTKQWIRKINCAPGGLSQTARWASRQNHKIWYWVKSKQLFVLLIS
jgi:hypothetical protein